MAFRQVEVLEIRAWGKRVGALAHPPGVGHSVFEYDRRWRGPDTAAPNTHTGAWPVVRASRWQHAGCSRKAAAVDSFPDLARETGIGEERTSRIRERLRTVRSKAGIG